jgi:hypothetical protein
MVAEEKRLCGIYTSSCNKVITNVLYPMSMSDDPLASPEQLLPSPVTPVLVDARAVLSTVLIAKVSCCTATPDPLSHPPAPPPPPPTFPPDMAHMGAGQPLELQLETLAARLAGARDLPDTVPRTALPRVYVWLTTPQGGGGSSACSTRGRRTASVLPELRAVGAAFPRLLPPPPGGASPIGAAGGRLAAAHRGRCDGPAQSSRQP